MGSCEVIGHETLFVLPTQRPAPTFDPEARRSVGLAPEAADVAVVRSAHP